MRLTLLEAQYLLALIKKDTGEHTGYSSNPQISALQFKLSILLQTGHNMNDPTEPEIKVRA